MGNVEMLDIRETGNNVQQWGERVEQHHVTVMSENRIGLDGRDDVRPILYACV